jgi:hypothetical protein
MAVEREIERQLRDYFSQLDDLCRRGASEDSIRPALLGFLRSVFPRIEQAEPILLEKHIPALRVRGGYADALYGDLILECKRRLNDKFFSHQGRRSDFSTASDFSLSK